MKKRKPFQLKTFMVFYNIYQIAFCSYVIKGILEDPEVPPLEYFSRCQSPVYYYEPNDFYKFALAIYFLKASEMCETVIFVLRKKWNQVSVLHVFHHCAVLVLAYLAGMSGHSKLLNNLFFLT